MDPSLIKNWLLAIRPKTLPASIAPVVMGTAMAFGDGIGHFPTALLCLLGAILIQIGTNLANDYFDHKKGTDTDERSGPIRVTQAGLIAPSQMIIATILTFALASGVAWILYLRGGTPIAVIGITAILSGIFYTAGPRPLGYLGLGDIFVLIFFGPVAVAGTYYVQSYEINPAIILAGFAPGLFSTAILTVNNLRDIDTDRKSNKFTLAVRFGRSFAQMEYLFTITAACLTPLLVYAVTFDHPLTLISVAVLFFALPIFMTILTDPRGESLNEALAKTGKLLFIYAALFSLGWLR